MATDTVTRGVVFRCYELPISISYEVCVEDGVITHADTLPDEIKDPWVARAIANMWLAAADELETANGR